MVVVIYSYRFPHRHHRLPYRCCLYQQVVLGYMVLCRLVVVSVLVFYCCRRGGVAPILVAADPYSSLQHHFISPLANTEGYKCMTCGDISGHQMVSTLAACSGLYVVLLQPYPLTWPPRRGARWHCSCGVAHYCLALWWGTS